MPPSSDTPIGNYSRSIQITKPAVTSKTGMVTANHPVAARAGAKILATGGNAVDAAIATSMMLGVCEPWMSGLGGCGQMLIYMAATKEVRLVDFGTVSPQELTPSDFILTGEIGRNMFNWPTVNEDINNIGAKSICVPTLLGGMETAHRNYGTKPWADLIMPAAQHAEAGITIDAYASLFISSAARDLQKNKAAAALFLQSDKLPPSLAWSNGQPITQPMPQLAQTLRTIAHEGSEAFYHGEIGQRLTEDVQALGGYLTMDDLIHYKAKDEPAAKVDIDECTISTGAPHTAGPALIKAMSVLGKQSLRTTSALDTPQAMLRLVKTLFEVAQSNDIATAQDRGSPRESCTTHFNVIDRDGNLVVVTQTLLSVFGSSVISPQTGILLNNGTLWFDPVPDRPNSIGASKRPQSNMCPVIAQWENAAGAPAMLGIGAAGGRRIMPAVIQILLRILGGEDITSAFHAPRVETSRTENLVADFRLASDILTTLRTDFNVTISERHFYPYAFACPAGIYRSGGMNSGCTETYSLWGDTISEEMLLGEVVTGTLNG